VQTRLTSSNPVLEHLLADPFRCRLFCNQIDHHGMCGRWLRSGDEHHAGQRLVDIAFTVSVEEIPQISAEPTVVGGLKMHSTGVVG
jgi:hypothetical protein